MSDYIEVVATIVLLSIVIAFLAPVTINSFSSSGTETIEKTQYIDQVDCMEDCANVTVNNDIDSVITNVTHNGTYVHLNITELNNNSYEQSYNITDGDTISHGDYNITISNIDNITTETYTWNLTLDENSDLYYYIEDDLNTNDETPFFSDDIAFRYDGLTSDSFARFEIWFLDGSYEEVDFENMAEGSTWELSFDKFTTRIILNEITDTNTEEVDVTYELLPYHLHETTVTYEYESGSGGEISDDPTVNALYNYFPFFIILSMILIFVINFIRVGDT